MILAGIVALIHPALSSVAVVLFLGWLLIIAGILRAISLIGARHVALMASARLRSPCS